VRFIIRFVYNGSEDPHYIFESHIKVALQYFRSL
jgi:hypothetical protein